MSDLNPEPWRIENRPGGSAIIGADNKAITLDSRRRIVACVNACRGIPTEVLEKQGLSSVITALSKYADLATAHGQEGYFNNFRTAAHYLIDWGASYSGCEVCFQTGQPITTDPILDPL